MHQHDVPLPDPVDGALPHRGVPRRDGEGEEALAGLRNGQAELGDPIIVKGS